MKTLSICVRHADLDKGYLGREHYLHNLSVISAKESWISSGVMAQEIHSTLDGQYEFDTFLIGTSLATQFIEKEDEVRSKYRIRGKISIKSHITSEVREKFQRLTSAKEVFEKPDLMITLNIFWNKGHTISTRARSMIAAGRYTKNQRGISQREPKPQNISNLADNRPNIANNSSVRSVEAIISDKVIAAYRM